VALAALGGAIVVTGPIQAKPRAARPQAAASGCSELGEILFAALGEYALPTDNFSSEKPEVPDFPEGKKHDRLMPIRRNSGDVWLSGWKGLHPKVEHVDRWFDTHLSSAASCLRNMPEGHSQFGRLFANWSDKKAAPAERTRSDAWTYRVSLPVLDKSGMHALVFYESYGPGLAGGTSFVYVERAGSGWRKVGERLLTNS
jgi:hypothetical protein